MGNQLKLKVTTREPVWEKSAHGASIGARRCPLQRWWLWRPRLFSEACLGRPVTTGHHSASRPPPIYYYSSGSTGFLSFHISFIQRTAFQWSLFTEQCLGRPASGHHSPSRQAPIYMHGHCGQWPHLGTYSYLVRWEWGQVLSNILLKTFIPFQFFLIHALPY